MKFMSALAVCLTMVLVLPFAASASPPTWTVFFARESAALPPDGAAVAYRALETAVTQGATKIDIVGHTDTTEPGAMELSQQRADAVKAYLVSRGVPSTIAIATSGVGASDPMVQSGPTLSQAANRYVTMKVH